MEGEGGGRFGGVGGKFFFFNEWACMCVAVWQD